MPILTLKTRLYIWLLNRGIVKVKPWNDPRRPDWERAMWLKSEPKSLRKVG